MQFTIEPKKTDMFLQKTQEMLSAWISELDKEVPSDRNILRYASRAITYYCFSWCSVTKCRSFKKFVVPNFGGWLSLGCYEKSINILSKYWSDFSLKEGSLHIDEMRDHCRRGEFEVDFGESNYFEHVLSHINIAWHYHKMTERAIANCTQDEYEKLSVTVPNICGRFVLVDSDGVFAPFEEKTFEQM